ncbi:MAG: YHYH protein [Moraxellaceae bacterium]|nr:YHYH protein [Moraxellaceae bacterium]
MVGLSDLDECNGRTGVTPEFPKGTDCVITDTYPFIGRCLKGTSAAAGGGMPPGRTSRRFIPPPMDGSCTATACGLSSQNILQKNGVNTASPL